LGSWVKEDYRSNSTCFINEFGIDPDKRRLRQDAFWNDAKSPMHSLAGVAQVPESELIH
jgi:hypothetical protein